MTKQRKLFGAFSLSEALITLLVVSIITIATIPVITKKHRDKTNVKHGMYACYWDGNKLVAKQIVDGVKTTQSTQFDPKENRYGCVFNPPPGAKNFVATIVGAGGGGSGSGYIATTTTKFYSEPGTYTFTTPEAGFYKILAVGAGGGGGDGQGVSGKRACTGSSGSLVYVPMRMLSKDVIMEITVGKGGDAGWANENSASAGAAGGLTSVTVSSDVWASANGGEGGCSYYYDVTCTNSKNCSYRNFYAKMNGYSSDGKPQSVDETDTEHYTIIDNKPEWESYAKNFYSGSAGKGSSSLSNARIVNGTSLGCLTSASQQDQKIGYNLLSSLTDYSSHFNIEFNKITNNNGKYNQTFACSAKNYNWENSATCKNYSNYYGAGGGGSGSIKTDHAGRQHAPVYTIFTKNQGGNGLVAISYSPVFAGMGGEAGNVIQVPYAEMSQKTLLFPGKGGAGGVAATNIIKNSVTNRYSNNTQSAGKIGQSSYIKNGNEILGGSGAKEITPDDEKTYSKERNSQYMPSGGNGEIADILTTEKSGNGGLGGFNTGDVTNTSIHGLTQTVFRKSLDIGSFKNIYGAGAGGGGGAVSVNGSSFSFGNGGNGSSGLVFIQW